MRTLNEMIANRFTIREGGPVSQEFATHILGIYNSCPDVAKKMILSQGFDVVFEGTLYDVKPDVIKQLLSIVEIEKGEKRDVKKDIALDSLSNQTNKDQEEMPPIKTVVPNSHHCISDEAKRYILSVYNSSPDMVKEIIWMDGFDVLFGDTLYKIKPEIIHQLASPAAKKETNRTRGMGRPMPRYIGGIYSELRPHIKAAYQRNDQPKDFLGSNIGDPNRTQMRQQYTASQEKLLDANRSRDPQPLVISLRDAIMATYNSLSNEDKELVPQRGITVQWREKTISVSPHLFRLLTDDGLNRAYASRDSVEIMRIVNDWCDVPSFKVFVSSNTEHLSLEEYCTMLDRILQNIDFYPTGWPRILGTDYHFEINNLKVTATVATY